MPDFVNRTVGTGGQTRNYLNNLAANLLDYAFPLDAPTEFMPPGNPGGAPSYRGIGAYPFVVSVYDLNNWVATVPIGTTYQAVIETKTYVQLWNPHNFPTDGLGGVLTVHYQNSDKVNVNGTLQTLSSPPDATVIFKDPALRRCKHPSYRKSSFRNRKPRLALQLSNQSGYRLSGSQGKD